MFLPIEDGKTPDPVFPVVGDLVKIPRRVLDEYLATKRSAEIAWAVTNASPKFRSAKYEKIVPPAPWQKQIEAIRWQRAKDAAERLRKEGQDGNG